MDRPEAYPTKRNRPRCLATSRPGGFRGKEDGRSHLEAQADHGDKIMEDFTVFHTAARRGDDLCGELGDVVAEFGAQEDFSGEGKLDAAADAEHGLECLGLGEENVLFERLIRGFLTGAAEDLHTTAGGGEELDLAAVPGGFPARHQ